MNGLIAGLAGAMQGGGQALQQNAHLDMQRESSLAQARGLEQIKAEVMRDRQSRVAEIIGSVGKTTNDPTHPEGVRAKTAGEYNREVSGALSGKGLIEEGERFERAADRFEDNQRQSKRDDASEARYAAESDERTRHNRRMEGISAGNAARSNRLTDLQLQDAAEKRDKEKRHQGLIGGYSTLTEKGDKEGAETYRRTIVAEGGKDPRGIAKDDPLSSQVSAAKAVLADFEATAEDKEAARAVLRMANESYTAKSGKPGTPNESLPPGLPEGAKKVGTNKGRPVYQAPNGKMYIVD